MTDVIIVGAGSAGNVLARRFLDAGRTVVLVEAGKDDLNPDIRHLYNLGKIWHSEDDWDYFTVPQPGANNRRIHLPRGKVMGGSHALNAAIWVRGARQDYDTWAYLGCAGWGWEDVLPYFKKIESFDGGASELHGDEGLLDVRTEFERSPVQESMVEAAQQAGFPLNPDYNAGDPEGVSRMQLTIRDGERFNTWHAYLKPEAENPRLTILRSSRVRRVLLEDGRAVGVALQDSEGEISEQRAPLVVLAAGALGSPEILLRSGIGPREELESAGIDVAVDLPGVGRNLHDHLLSPVIFSVGTQTPIAAPSVAPAEVHLFAKSRPELAVPDTQPIFFSVPMYSEGYPGGMTGPEQGFTLMAGIVRPASRGAITLNGPELEDGVSVDLDALGEQADVDALIASVKHCREIGRQAALAEAWGAEEIWPGPDVSDEGLEQYVRDSVVTYHHQVGTCAMGIGPDAVVDPARLQVRGVPGLHVVDASVMPLVPTGNTNAPTIMIAEKAAEALLG